MSQDERDIVVETRPRLHVASLVGEEVEMRFADRSAVLSAIQVAQLGGAEHVRSRAEQFGRVRYEDFMRAHNLNQERKALSSLGAGFIAGALRRRVL